MLAPGCTKRSPRSGSISPAAILSSVDLPEPLRPTRHTRSPAETDSSTPSSSGWPPKVSAISLSWRGGGGMKLSGRGSARLADDVAGDGVFLDAFFAACPATHRDTGRVHRLRIARNERVPPFEAAAFGEAAVGASPRQP